MVNFSQVYNTYENIKKYEKTWQKNKRIHGAKDILAVNLSIYERKKTKSESGYRMENMLL